MTRPGGYSSSASVVARQVVTDPRGDESSRGVSAQTERNIMASTVVAQRVADIVDRDVDADDLLKRLTVASPEDESFVNSPQDTIGAHAVVLGVDSRTRPRRRAGVRRRIPRVPGESVRRAKERTLANIDAEIARLQNAQNQAVAAVAAAPPDSAAAIQAQNQVELLEPRIIDAQSDRSTISAVDTTAGEVIGRRDSRAAEPASRGRWPSSRSTVLGTIVGVVIALDPSAHRSVSPDAPRLRRERSASRRWPSSRP